MILGEFIRTSRMNCGLSVEQLALKTGIRSVRIRNMELNRINADRKDIFLISESCGLNVREVIKLAGGNTHDRGRNATAESTPAPM